VSAVAEVVEVGGDVDAWGALERRPGPLLADGVRQLGGYWEQAAGPQRRRHLPSGSLTLIVGAEPLLLVDGPGAGAGAVRSFVAGLHDRPAVSEHAGRQSGIEVRLTPLAARRLFGVPLHELFGTVTDLADLLGPVTEELTDRALGPVDWPERLAAADAVLGRLLGAAPAPDPLVAEAWRRLDASAGALPIAELAASLGCSRRHLSQRFGHEVGMTPKAYARALRFERAVAALDGPVPPALATLAATCGYYDQAHFNREFRALAGCSPREYLGARLPSGGTAA
jgi:AraC-like DNA-binding protein